jgi:hypothetical protein
MRQTAADKKPKKVFIDDPGGEGWEIVQEVAVCPDCAISSMEAPPSPKTPL